MTRPAPAPGAVGALLATLIDDAGLFPPASLSMEDAVGAHLQARAGEHRWILGRFLCPLTRMEELAAALPAGMDQPIGLTVLVDEGDPATAAERAAVGPWHLEAVETRYPGVQRDAGAMVETVLAAVGQGSVAVFVEVPLAGTAAPEAARLVAGLAGTRAGVKLRCGGVTPEMVPTCAALAGAISAATSAGVLVKATAGLHHPFRHFDGLARSTVHGFLNLLAAVVAADAGGTSAEVERVLASEDVSAFTLDAAGFGWGRFVAGAATIRRLRAERFAGFGSCSFAEPVEHLVARGFLSGAGVGP